METHPCRSYILTAEHRLNNVIVDKITDGRKIMVVTFIIWVDSNEPGGRTRASISPDGLTLSSLLSHTGRRDRGGVMV